MAGKYRYDAINKDVDDVIDSIEDDVNDVICLLDGIEGLSEIDRAKDQLKKLSLKLY